MNERPAPDLDHFEARLLGELKLVVDTQASSLRPTAGAASVAPPDLPRRRRPAYAVFAGAAAAAAVGIAAVVTVAQPTPAYAVTGGNGEEVTVRVMRLEGAGALEEALRERGIPADITYLSAGTACAPGRYDDVRAPDLSLSVGSNQFEVTIPPGAIEDDNTFVLSATAQPTEDGFTTFDFGVAEGAVAPCTVIDAP